ncbi:hypothetical protein GCM10010919_28420 [Alishewanella longhuensis]|uniref:Lipopolysaccharide assembly protein A domain-containing protein n=1 Tax=Alishewanella longhuensis TaxID=1091037 RepID=A0ABQ3L0J6_9ALTE|nr:DUF1049 domain-containing protein [Alishewanella longhuensis]GHG74720.1 hypothetical protein GCM10010919_28420 [Alishewanella longhuensis]
MLRKVLFLIFSIAVLLLGFLLGSTNQQLTELNLLVVKLNLRVVDIAVIFLIVGIVLGLLFSLFFALQRKTKRWLTNSTEKT